MAETLEFQHMNDPVVITFINSYLSCRDVVQASYEANITRRDGRNLLERRDIRMTIRRITELALVKYNYDAEEVVERVKEVGFFDPADVEDPDTGVFYKSLRDIPIELRRVIKKLVVKNTYSTDPNGLKEANGEIITIEFHDKLKALELLGREKQVFKQQVVNEHEIGKNAANILLSSIDRAKERLERLRDVTQLDAPDE